MGRWPGEVVLSVITLPHKYKPRDYQRAFWKAFDEGKNICIVWARRHGKDLTCWNAAIRRGAEEPMTVNYVYPTTEMARDNLWEAKTNEGLMFTDFIPMDLRARNNKSDDGLNSTLMQVKFINNTNLRLRTGDNPDRLRGGNPKLYVLSELAEMDPGVIDVIEPVVEANHGQIVVNFTPKGDNHAKAMVETWQKDPRWFVQIITADDTDVFTEEQLARIRQGLINRYEAQGRSKEEAIAFFEQEYYCSFETPVIGAYFGAAMKRAEEENRITSVPYDPATPVYTVWDLGVDDSTTIWFYQIVGREFHFIDYYEMSGEGIPHYANYVNSKGYAFREHYWPHDGKAREFGTGRTREETAILHGLHPTILKKYGKDDQIEAARSIISRCWFDEEKCKRGIQALKMYRKEWDEKLMKFKNKPKHDWSSHGADAFMQFSVIQHSEGDYEELPVDDDPFEDFE